jgi:hypothetical protein
MSKKAYLLGRFLVMFENALCDLGASVSVMPKKVFDKLNYSTLTPTSMCLQLAAQSVRYPAESLKIFW